VSSDIPGPPRKLRRRPWIEAEFASLDFETTGLDPRRDAVVSFGVVPVRRGRVILAESVYREVAPAVPLTATSIVIHGIRPIDLRGAPAIAEARSELHAALDGRYVLAWAAEVEADFLATVFSRRPANWLRRIVDVLRLAVLADRIDGSVRLSGDYALAAAAQRYGVPMERPHHALDDALTTAQLFLVLATRLSKYGYGTPRRLLRASARPIPR
jgi:DNA polymerase-3 subunit epsilon